MERRCRFCSLKWARWTRNANLEVDAGEAERKCNDRRLKRAVWRGINEEAKVRILDGSGRTAETRRITGGLEAGRWRARKNMSREALQRIAAAELEVLGLRGHKCVWCGEGQSTKHIFEECQVVNTLRVHWGIQGRRAIREDPPGPTRSRPSRSGPRPRSDRRCGRRRR